MPAAMAGRSSGGETAKPDRTGGGGGGGGSSGNANGGQAQAQPHTPTSTSERIYSAKQLTEALKSGMAAVKDQLQVRMWRELWDWGWGWGWEGRRCVYVCRKNATIQRRTS